MLWKQSNLKKIYLSSPTMYGFVIHEGEGSAKTNAYIRGSIHGKNGKMIDIGMDIFHRGLCLPSDIAMTPEQQDVAIAIKNCFR